MYLEYSHSEGGNFGDDLNPWLWPKLIPECLDENDGTAFIGIGTLLDQSRVARFLGNARKIVVFSSGAGFSAPPEMDDRWRVYCVRGPHTARKLGLPADKGLVDGAYLLRTVDLPKPEMRYAVSFMPHHRSEDFIDWKEICDAAGVHFISPKQPVDRVLEQLLATRLLITEAMHGAIVADALRIPWIPVKYSPKFMLEKWLDFTSAIRVRIDPVQLPQVYQKRPPWPKTLENAIKLGFSKLGLGPAKWSRLPAPLRLSSSTELKALAGRLQEIATRPPLLSDVAVAESLTRELSARLEQVRADYLAGELTG